MKALHFSWVIPALFLPSFGSQPQPFHEWIDGQIEAKAIAAGEEISGTCDDATFLRRAYLDFAGTIPAPEDVLAFVADPSGTKRTALVDKLLDAPEYAARMADAFHVMLMERRGPDEKWQKYLAESFAKNKPWDQIAREILNPDFMDEATQGAGYFITNRLSKVGQQDTDYPGLTRDVGRLFMGVDLQCAQCHKHLTVDDYDQIDFNGLYMVFKNLKHNNPNAYYKTPYVTEGLMDKRYEFTSVFSGKSKTTPPRIPFGKEIPIPELAKDDLWEVAPDRKKRIEGIPKFKPLLEVATNLTHPDNSWFARNAANRLWFLLMGRGIIHPLDLAHSKNPPSHPELLDRLAQEFVAHNHDIKWFLRELALTRTYQLSSVLPSKDANATPSLFTTAIERPLTANQLRDSFLKATAEPRTKELDEAFHNAFANPPKEPELQVNPTLRSALFLRNSTFVDTALQPKDGNLLKTLENTLTPDELANTLFLTILTRQPDNYERQLVSEHLASTQDRTQSLQQLAWSLLASMEFFANH